MNDQLLENTQYSPLSTVLASDWKSIFTVVVYPYLHLKDAERIVDAILEEMAEALMRGDRVELRGFGALSVRYRPQRSGRSPKTNKMIFVEEKWVPFFRAGKDMQHRLNANGNSGERQSGSSPTE